MEYTQTNFSLVLTDSPCGSTSQSRTRQVAVIVRKNVNVPVSDAVAAFSVYDVMYESEMVRPFERKTECYIMF